MGLGGSDRDRFGHQVALLCELSTGAHGQETVAVLHSILSQLCASLQADRAFIHTFESNGRIGRAYERLRPGAQARLPEGALTVGSHPRAELEAGRPLAVALEGSEPPRVAILIPLRSQHRTAGVLGLETLQGGLGTDPSIMPWLRVLAASVSNCLTQQQHQQKQAQRHFELTTIDQLHHLLEGCASLTDLARGCSRLILDVFGCERVSVLQSQLADPAGLQVLARAGRSGSEGPLKPDAARNTELQGILQTSGVRTLGGSTGRPPFFNDEGRIRSQAWVTMRPSPHCSLVLVLDQTSFDRDWTVDEKWLLSEVGRRLSEGAANLMSVQELEVSENRYRQILAAIPDLILVFHPDGRLEDVFSASPDLLGVPRTQALGRHLRELFPRTTADALWPVLQRVAHGSLVEQVEYGLSMGGRDRWFMAQARGFGTHDRRRVLWVARDVTERRDLQARLLQAQKLESVGLLAGGVAHDFNNLLTAVLGYVDLVQSELSPDHPLQSDLEQIWTAGQRGTRLAKQLLAFARKDTMVPAPVNLDELLSSMVSMLRRVVGDEVQLQTLPESEGAVVMIDPGQLEQVIMNLVVNARDAMPGGGVVQLRTGRGQVDEDTAELTKGSYAWLEVEDSGVGMDRDTQVQIFDPFFTTKEMGKGTGLGLATCYGIIRQHKGRIEVHSQVGQGTRFRIWLPVADAQPAPSSSDSDGVEPRGAETVLLVEDEPHVRRLAERGLESFGYRVLAAGSGQEAIRMSVQHDGPIHLLITDMMMPGMRGTQLSGLLLEARPGMRVLYVSGYSEDLPSVARAGKHRFVQKPFTPRELARKAREVLDA